jgi:uncharacterized membrane protein
MTRLASLARRLNIDVVAAPTWLVIVAWCGLVVGTVGRLLLP